MRTIIKPFRIKMTGPIRLISREEKIKVLIKVHQNIFLLDAEDCCINLLTNSGTGAMSTEQWAALILEDDSCAGSKSWKKKDAIPGYRITYQPKFLRHFTCCFEAVR